MDSTTATNDGVTDVRPRRARGLPETRREALAQALRYHDEHGFTSDEGDRKAAIVKTAGTFETYLTGGSA